ncbi:MAG: hypothetical protein O2877_01420 [bacterium]|nr:hypothetical protein [bacterium]
MLDGLQEERRLAAHDKSDCDACALERSDEIEAAVRDTSADLFDIVHDRDRRFRVVRRVTFRGASVPLTLELHPEHAATLVRHAAAWRHRDLVD